MPTRRRRRSVEDEGPPFSDDTVVDLTYSFDHGLDYHPRADWTWPTESGISEGQAREACENAIQGLGSYEKCSTEAQVDQEPVVRTCMADIKVSW